MTPDFQDMTEAELLSRLQSQFGDMDLTQLLDADKKKKQNGSDSEESSLAEPTPEELQAWQEAQFQKGQQSLEVKKRLDMPPAQRRRDVPYFRDEEDWEQVASLPQLDEKSVFFTDCDESGNEFLGIHPLLQELSSADPEILGTKWKRLYSSAQGDGLSFHLLLSTLKGYGGPTVMLISGSPSADHSIDDQGKASTMGFFTTSTWSESADFFGSDDCFLFTLNEEENHINFLRPVERKKSSNFMYCHPSSLSISNRRSKISLSATDGCVHGIGVGGTPSQPRLHLTETLEECRAMEHCSTFETGELLQNGKDCLYYFDANCIEVWGVGGDAWIQQGLEAQQKGRDLTEATLRRVRQVDKKQFLDDLRFMGKPSGFFEHVEHTANRTDL
jgi:hypothetical protein